MKPFENLGDQKMKKIFSVLALLFCITGCGNQPAPAKSLTSISVSGQKTVFTVDDQFTFDGIVTAKYSDGSESTVTDKTTFSGYDMSVASIQTVTASYVENTITKTCQYTIEVRNPVLSSIEVEGPISSLTRYGQFSFDGHIIAHYENGKTKDVTYLAQFSNYDMSKYGYQDVTASYQENGVTKSCQFEMLVEIEEADISVKNCEYTKNNGSFNSDANEIVTSSGNTLALVKDSRLVQGTITLDVTSNSRNCYGIVFLTSHNVEKFWEQNGVTYYFLFINEDGHLCLGKTVNGEWVNIVDKSIAGYNENNKYNLKVSYIRNNDGGVAYNSIFCYLDNQLYLIAKDYEENIGVEFGIRAGSSGTIFSHPQISGHVSLPSRKQIEDLYISNGSFIYENNRYISKNNNSIGYIDQQMELGTLKVDMYHSDIVSDSGLVFGLERNSQINFWEKDISYYFFFIANNGFPYLGRVNNGSWSALQVSNTSVPGFPFNVGEKSELKVIRSDNKIECFVDNVKYIDYKDNAPLLGKEVGIRAGTQNYQFGNISVVNSGSFVFFEPTEYKFIKGHFITTDDVSIISDRTDSLALNAHQEFTNGTLTLKFTQGNQTESGIIFKSDDTASNYYAFFIKNGRTHLVKVINNIPTELVNDLYLSAGYGPAQETNMKIVYDNGEIYCYFRNILYAKFTDNSPLNGTKFGIYSKLPLACFSNIEITNSTEHETNKTLVIGHSYMELWSNYKNDLSKFEDINNIGIGGSVSSDWNEMEDNIVAYNPETIIYCIGTNDLVRYGVTPQIVKNNVDNLLTNLKNRLSSLSKIILVSVNRCPLREDYVSQINQINTFYREIANDTKYEGMVKLADVDNAFLSGGVPNPIWFTDGLHPTSEAYLVIRDAIYAAAGMED